MYVVVDVVHELLPYLTTILTFLYLSIGHLSGLAPNGYYR